jgi:glycosyltransferase involved in cell wall biosynthesis
MCALIAKGIVQGNVVKGGLREKGIVKTTKERQPLVTIITVVYNRADGIESTIKSVLALNYPNREYIVVDGGSTDGTVDIIKKYDDQLDYFVSERDNGIYDAMNKAIDLATGKWINFMNCGDRFASPDALQFFPDAPDADVLYGNAVIEYPTFKKQWRNFPVEDIWKGMPFCHQAVFVRTSLMKERKFDTKYKISADFDFFYALFRDGKTFQHVDTLICLYDYREGASKRLAILSTEEKEKVLLKYGFDLRKWIYYSGMIFYIYISTMIKAVIGNRLTTWITQFLRASSRT